MSKYRLVGAIDSIIDGEELYEISGIMIDDSERIGRSGLRISLNEFQYTRDTNIDLFLFVWVDSYG